MENTEIRTVAKKSLADILEEFEVEKTAKMVVTAIQGISETAQELRAPEGPLMTSLNNIEKMTGHVENSPPASRPARVPPAVSCSRGN